MSKNQYRMIQQSALMRKSFGDHSLGTELLSKHDKIDYNNNDYFPKHPIINGSDGAESSSKYEDRTSNERASINEETKHLISKFIVEDN